MSAPPSSGSCPPVVVVARDDELMDPSDLALTKRSTVGVVDIEMSVWVVVWLERAHTSRTFRGRSFRMDTTSVW